MGVFMKRLQQSDSLTTSFCERLWCCLLKNFIYQSDFLVSISPRNHQNISRSIVQHFPFPPPRVHIVLNFGRNFFVRFQILSNLFISLCLFGSVSIYVAKRNLSVSVSKPSSHSLAIGFRLVAVCPCSIAEFGSSCDEIIFIVRERALEVWFFWFLFDDCACRFLRMQNDF